MNQPNSPWHPASWRQCPVQHQPYFKDPAHVEASLAMIAGLPPLVQIDEIEALKAQMQAAYAGDAFLLQAGACAEMFADCTAANIGQQIKIMTQMSMLLSCFLDKPIIKIGRIAGQYAKPRSSTMETIGGIQVPAYLGDSVNGLRLEERTPDPARLVHAYFHAAATLNHLRALLAPLLRQCHQPATWDIGRIDHPWLSDDHAVAQLTARYAAKYAADPIVRADSFFTSHEGLVLAAEERQTHYSAKHDAWYNLSAHMLWIGERTRSLTGAHVEFFRGIANPIGVKVGPDADPGEILAVIRKLAPHNRPGKVTLITRFGNKHATKLRPLVAAVQAAGASVLWVCDPMHGNTTTTASGHKTRLVADILAEVRGTFAVHRELGTQLHGLHLELSGDHVTECVGGSVPVAVEGLSSNYQTSCDPRLNYGQGLDIALAFAELTGHQGVPAVDSRCRCVEFG